LAVLGESSTIETVVLLAVAEAANATAKLPEVKFCAWTEGAANAIASTAEAKVAK